MFRRIKMLYHAIAAWASQTTQVSNRVDLERLECLSPIDRYVVCSGVFNNQALFDPVYEDWRIKRLNKMLEIYGIDYFKGRKILELGGGHGDIGAFFAELGADVLSLDGRIQNVNFARLKHRKVENIKFVQFNLEHDFSSFGRFDLIINFGLLYHLRHVEEHLKCCFSMADDIVLETVVCDSSDPDKIVFCQERSAVDEESLEGTGSRPSPFYVEKIATENNFQFVRYFTPDLNSGGIFSYDWPHRNDGRGARGDNFELRRFWRLQKK